MQSAQTPRYKLPLLAIGQAQKELFHNEALVLLDFLIRPIVLAQHADPSSLDPADGEAWLVDQNTSGEWASRQDQIAIWTAGGWRFIEPVAHSELFVVSVNETAVFRDGNWVFGGSVFSPVGGSTIDVEARQAIESILAALRIKGVIEN